MGDRPWDDAISHELDKRTDVSQVGADIATVPLLLQHGRNDPDVPLASAEVLYQALSHHYASSSESLQFRIYPHLGHTISRPESPEIAADQEQLRTDLNDWFIKHL